jgi:predicted metal-dependent hydrolase
VSKTTRHQLRLDTTVIDYDLVRTPRKTVGITVHRDGRVTVRAPLRAPAGAVAAIVRRKSPWITKKRQQFAKLPPPPPAPRYVSGEIHYFLGQPYELRLVTAKKQGAVLDGRCLLLSVNDPGNETRRRRLLTEWYRARAKEIFPARLQACHAAAAPHAFSYPELKIRLMKARWGSCSSTGTMLLNLRLIQTPLASIDYVIFHELAHLQVPAHNKAFYALLDELLPDWRARRQALNQFPVA